MRSHSKTLTILATSLLVAGVLAAGVDVDYDRSADFAKYTDYAWQEGTPAGGLMQKRIVAAIDHELAADGLERAEGEAGLYVVTHASVDSEQRIEVDDFGYMGRRRGWGGMTTVDVQDVAVGTLVVDLIDADSGDLVWRGLASEALSSKAEKNEKKINKAVMKMFKKFPPPAE